MTVTGSFDVSEWRRRLMAPPVGQRIAIPENWWRNMLAITDVVLQRQQLDPATGQWGSVETLPPLPNNRFGYLRREGDTFNGDDALEIIHTVAANEDPDHARAAAAADERPPVGPAGRRGSSLTPEQDKRLGELNDEIARLQEHEHLGNPGGGQRPVPSAHTPSPHHGNPGKLWRLWRRRRTPRLTRMASTTAAQAQRPAVPRTRTLPPPTSPPSAKSSPSKSTT